MYNVLWIDDEYDKMTAFQQECEDFNGLHLEPFRTRKAGMEALEKDLDHWDAVLLDAKMFDESENEVANLTGLGKAKQRLDELSMKRTIPYFISTGKPDLISDKNFRSLFGDYYEKAKDDERLIEDMKKAIENSDKAQILNRYKDVFDALSSLEIRNEVESILTGILLPMHYPAKDPNFKPVLHFNPLRQVLEYLFRACHKVGLIPDQCMAGTNINLNQCSLYLAGKTATKAGVKYDGPGARIIPEHIESFIRSVLEFGNTHSHTAELSEEDKSKIESIFRSKRSGYIIFGLTMQICEVITWLADYIGEHNDKEINLSFCKELPKDGAMYNGREMIPEQDEDGIWHCGECVISFRPEIIDKHIRLRDVQPNTRRAKEKYPYFAYYDQLNK